DEHHSELRANCVGFRENLHDLLGRGIAGHVVIGGIAAEKKIAHASADEISLMAFVAERADGRDSEGLHWFGASICGNDTSVAEIKVMGFETSATKVQWSLAI